MSHGKTDQGSGASYDYRLDSPTTDVLHEGANTCRHNHIELIRTEFCSDLHQEEGWKYWNMFITKLNIMFAARQHSDGHGLTCVCICMHLYSSNNDYGFC